MTPTFRALALFFVTGFLPAGTPGGAGPSGCNATIGVPFGSHYQPATRQESQLGDELLVQGQVRSATDCRPLSYARVEHWQAGNDGIYHERLRSYQLTDENGFFRFGTEWPRQSPPHIHFRVDAPGHGTLVSIWQQRDDAPQVPAISLDFVMEPR